MEPSGLTSSFITDIGSQSEWLPHACQNIDLGDGGELCGSSPPPIPGSLPVPTIWGDTNKRENFLIADHSDSAPSMLQELADSTLRRVGHARIPNVWESLNEVSTKFAHVERHRLFSTVVVT